MADAFVSRYKGDDWIFTFQYRQGEAQGCRPVNLTGYTIKGQLLVGANAPVDLTATSAMIDALKGRFKIVVPDASTTGLIADSPAKTSGFSHRVRANVLDPDGNIVTLGVVPVRVLAP
jgi:O-glycosyl hydrolase